MIDTGDLVRIKGTRDRWLVCCVHGPVVWLSCPGRWPFRLDDIELEHAASGAERLALLQALAGGTRGHRAECARARLADTDRA